MVDLYTPEPEELEHWLRLVHRDLADSQTLLKAEGLDNAAFLAQQACEKLLKTLLIEGGIEPPRTHNLLRLADLLPSHVDQILSRPLMRSMLGWAVEIRYNDSFDRPTVSDVAEVQAAVAAYLEKRGW